MAMEELVTILLVEDDPILALLETAKLNKQGYEVIHVTNGERSIEAIRSGKRKVDIVLMDINLGVGIDGTEAAAEILKIVDIPILFLSSHTEKEVVEKTEAITSYGYVVKDSGDLVLFASIKMALKLFQAKREEKKANEALRLKESFISAVLDNLPIGVAINSVEPTVDFSYANDNFIKIYRTSRESLRDPDSFWTAVYQDPEFREEIKKRVLTDCATGQVDRMVWEDIPIRREGEVTTYVSARNIPIEEKRLMVSLVWDVTQRKIFEDGLRESGEVFHFLVENLRELVISKDLDHRFIYANPAFFRAFDVTKSQVIGGHFLLPVHPSDKQIVDKAEKSLVFPPYESAYEARFFIKGTWRWLSWYISGIRQENGSLFMLIGTARDITEQKVEYLSRY
jgi:PAS domain S-box-containing protein